MARSVFIARNVRTGFHSVLEVVRGGAPSERTAPMDFELASELTRWGTLDELVSALSRSGPLIGRNVYEEESRCLEISEAIEILEASADGGGEFARCEEDFLYLQLCLEGTSATGSASALYPSRASVSRDVGRHGLIESDALSDLKAWESEDPACRVIVEPLRDLVLCRNLGSVLLRLVANVHSGCEDVLERSGFKLIDNKRRWWIPRELGDSYYVLPFQHNAAFDMTLNWSGRHFRNVYAYMVISPLEKRILDLRPKNDAVKFGSVPNAVLISAQVKTGKGRPFFDVGWKPEVEETQLYLGIDSDGTQREQAVRFIDETAKMLSGLRAKPRAGGDGREDSGSPLGWLIEEPSIYEDEPLPRYSFYSVAASMFGAILYRYGCVPATCKNCGNGMLVKTKGKRREFCSSSCRSAYSIRRAEL